MSYWEVHHSSQPLVKCQDKRELDHHHSAWKFIIASTRKRSDYLITYEQNKWSCKLFLRWSLSYASYKENQQFLRINNINFMTSSGCGKIWAQILREAISCTEGGQWDSVVLWNSQEEMVTMQMRKKVAPIFSSNSYTM